MEEKESPKAVKPVKEAADVSIGADPKSEEVKNIPVFSFEEGAGKVSKLIPMTLLSRSIRRESGLKGIRVIPIQYWKIYAIILSMLEEQNVNYDEREIYVQNNSSKAYLTDSDKESGYTQKNAPIDRWRFDKVISTIQLPGIIEGDNEGVSTARNAAIGLTLNKEGLSVAFGMNVQACANFDVMGGTIMRSYATSNKIGLPWEIMKIQLSKWIENINQIWTVQNEIMNTMKNHVLDSSDLDKPTGIVEKIIGDLYMGAIRQSYFDKTGIIPFNTYELSDFVQEIIRQRKEEEKLTNIWDVYNWGTSIMQPGKVDIGEISENSNTWADYLIKEFDLEVPKLEISE